MPSLPAPSPSSTPTEVRTYFTTLLTTLHGVPEPEAQAIAAKWRLGRGTELRSYDLTTFREIFGVEAGTVLYGHVKGVIAPTSPPLRSVRARNERPEKDIFGFTPGCESVLLFVISV